MNEQQPFIPAEKNLAEITFRGILLAIGLTIVLAMSNAFLALKIGLLTSASIPAAIISMGVLRFFKNSNVLENNLVQTAASAGEAVAGGIVYTIPALIIIQYWAGFSYWENFFIAAIGGVMGVLFSIPLRRVLVNEPSLKFPEGRAIAEVLKTSHQGIKIGGIVAGGLVGGFLELCQTGFKVIANSWQMWFVAKRMLFGFGAGFSTAMIGAGYLIGFNIAMSIFLGAALGWLFTVPLVSEIYPQFLNEHSINMAVIDLWHAKVRYVGIGAMLFAGVCTFLGLLKPLANSLKLSSTAVKSQWTAEAVSRTDKDIPFIALLFGIFGMAAILFVFFELNLPLDALGLDRHLIPSFIFGCVLYVFVIGFIFAAITGYFSGMVGVSASPGSSVIIAGMLLAAWLLYHLALRFSGGALTSHQVMAAEAITIIIGSVITGIAAIANDNMQDLKVGHILGATPWRQQVMLMLGVVVSALVIPPIMQLLFDVYGIAGVMPHPGMNPALSLPAPPAALMAAITQAVFHNNLPWAMIVLGALLILFVLACNYFLLKPFGFKFSILGVAIGIYLPIASSIPLFIGGLIASITQTNLTRKKLDKDERFDRAQRGTLIACGLVAGAALMDVVMAVPFSLAKSPDALKIVGDGWEPMAVILGGLTTLGLGLWFYRSVCK